MARKRDAANPNGSSLGTQDIHLWRARTQDLAADAGELAATLSPDEHRRAQGFASRDDRDAFVLRRGLLRVILSRYLALDPAEVGFCYGLHGKPVLDPRFGALSFSLSHAKELVVCAVSRRAALGVDVELVEWRPDLDGISARFFAEEADVVVPLPGDARLPAFYRRWVRQEAYLKATGEGLSAAPTGIEAGLAARGWKIEGIVPAPGYLGALVAEGGDWGVSWLEWREAPVGLVLSPSGSVAMRRRDP